MAVGVALAGVILTSLRGTEARLGAQIKDLRGEVGELRERMAKLEGLREASRRLSAAPWDSISTCG